MDSAALDANSVKYILVSKTASPVYAENLQREHYSQVYSDNNAMIFENADYLPSLSLVASLSETKILDPHRTAITDDQSLLAEAKKIGIPTATINTADVALGVVRPLSVVNTEVIASVTLTKPAVLVLSDTWHPNWRATVDGVPTYIGRVNEAFRGIVLPAGEHRVRFYYDPPALRYGIYISVAASGFFVILLMLSLLGRGFWNARRTINAGTISHLS